MRCGGSFVPKFIDYGPVHGSLRLKLLSSLGLPQASSTSQRSRKFHHTYWWSFFDVLYCTVAVDEFTPKSILFNWCPLKLGFTWVWKQKTTIKMLEECMFEFEMERWITQTWIEIFVILFFDTLSKGAFKKLCKYVTKSQLKKPSILLTIVVQCTWSFDLQFINVKSFHVKFFFLWCF